MIAWTPRRRRTLQITGIVVLLIFALLGWFAWYKFFRVVPQPDFISEDERFMYGSIGAEETAGIPYWILYVLPRVFPDKMPGPAGYASFGMAWQFGKELPIGFSKMTIGFDRVAQNCAVCHVATVRRSPMENPRFFPTGPNHTLNLEAFFRFLVDCGRDPRFNADAIMREIDLNSDLSWIDRQLYRFVYIPITRTQLLAREPRFRWIYFDHNPPACWPDWGPGRDDAMNLTKYFLTTSPVDDTLGPTDMPSIWNIGKYKAMEKFTGRENSTRLNFAGDSIDANSVIIDSALGLYGRAPPNNKDFLDKKDWLYKYLSSYDAPKFRDVFPNVIDENKAEAGKAVFAANCASCHWSDRTTGIPAPEPRDQIRTGTVVPVGEVGTDIERIRSWNKEAAIRSNQVVKDFGIERKGLVEDFGVSTLGRSAWRHCTPPDALQYVGGQGANPTGYIAAFLDGIWLRAPYLHNGSVPTLRDLLTPADQRPQLFYRGYTVYDTANGGFVSTEAQAQRLAPDWNMKFEDLWGELRAVATPYDVHWRSNGNMGHEYGVTLPEADKEALIEYLKTL